MNYVNCNLCGQDSYELLFPATLQPGEQPDVSAFRCTHSGYGHHAQIVRCHNCGYVYANPQWEADELLQLYGDVEDEIYVEERAGRRLTFQKHLHHFEKFTGPSNGRKLVDVGAYIGVFVEIACEAGWDARGVEPSTWGVKVAQANGVRVIEGTQDTLLQGNERFDALTMWDVIEHVPDPSAELSKAYELLNPGGYIAVHTMNVDSLMAKLLKSRWPWFMAMHIHYFSQKTLTKMMADNGFEIIWVGTRGRYLRLNYLASRLEGLNKGLGRFAHAVINGLGVAQIAVPVNFGDLFTVYGRKPK